MAWSMSDSTAARVREIVRQAHLDAQVPGMVLGVVRDGSTVHTAQAGFGLEPGTQSRIGSISKTFTATLVIRARDDGLLDIDAPIAEYLPALGVGAVTTRQILAHFSGLRREPNGSWWERATGGDVAALLADVDADALIHRPLRTHHYSNLGYGLLGALIEKVIGATWWDTLRTQLLEPAGMARTTYDPVPPFATGYVTHPYDGRLREEPRLDAGAMAPAGQLWSTIDDLASWAGFIAAPEAALLRPDSIAEMCAPISMHDDDWSGAHGLGFQMWRSRDRIFTGHTGSMPGYLAALMVHRPSGWGVISFVNAYTMSRGSIAGLAVRALDAVCDAEGDRPRTAPAAASAVPPGAAALLGPWWWMGRAYDATWDGALVLTYRGGDATPWRFTHAGDDRWRCHTGMNDGETLIIRRDAAGKPAELDIATFVFSRDPWPPQ